MKVGIGAAADIEKIERSIGKIIDKADFVIFTRSLPQTPHERSEKIEYRISDTPESDLVDALYNGDIDAAVRGTLPANLVMKNIKTRFGVEKLRRVALLEVCGGRCAGKKFLLAPVGVDEGWDVDDKLEFIKECRPLAKRLGLNDRVAVLSGGRTGDIGRHAVVDRTIRDAEEIAERSGAENCEILIEDAPQNHGIVIAPDGISGNLIFRTLCLLGNGDAHGAPVLNISKTFVDTSRAGSDYANALLLAVSLSDDKKYTP